MKLLAIASIVTIVAATADPQVTPRAELQPRQNSDPALLGWISASQFSDQRSCDFPATLTRSGSLAQCCAPPSPSGPPCIFWSSCSANTLFASQTSLFCDMGYCNTAVLVPTVGATSGQSALGCWATSLGKDPITIVRDIGSASLAAPSPTAMSSGNTGAASSRPTSVATSSSVSSSAGSMTPSTAAATKSSEASITVALQPLIILFGLLTLLSHML